MRTISGVSIWFFNHRGTAFTEKHGEYPGVT